MDLLTPRSGRKYILHDNVLQIPHQDLVEVFHGIQLLGLDTAWTKYELDVLLTLCRWYTAIPGSTWLVVGLQW
jgi:hypothetical protein